MTRPPAGIAHADWEATPASVAALLMELLEQNRKLLEQNRSLVDQVKNLATRVAQLEEQKGRSSMNSSQPPSSDGPGQRGSGSGSSGSGQGDGQRRKRGGQLGHPGHGRDLLPSELCDQEHDHLPSSAAAVEQASQGPVRGLSPGATRSSTSPR